VLVRQCLKHGRSTSAVAEVFPSMALPMEVPDAARTVFEAIYQLGTLPVIVPNHCGDLKNGTLRASDDRFRPTPAKFSLSALRPFRSSSGARRALRTGHSGKRTW
jgi:hypothetical protein